MLAIYNKFFLARSDKISNIDLIINLKSSIALFISNNKFYLRIITKAGHHQEGMGI